MDMADSTRKMSDVAVFYAQDPINDPGGGWKTRSRTIEKSYRPDVDNLANAWMCVSGPDGTGTYKVLQKDLPLISPNCWMLVGENEGLDDHWHSAKYKVGDYLELNGVTGWPPFGPVEFVDMAPHQPGNLDHITNNNNGTGTAWAYPNTPIIIKAQSSGDPTNAVYPISECTFTWRVSSGPVFVNDLNVQAPTFNFTGGGGEMAQITVQMTHTPTGQKAEGMLIILGENAK